MQPYQSKASAPDTNLNTSGPTGFKRTEHVTNLTQEQLAGLRSTTIQGRNLLEIYNALFCNPSGACIARSREGLHRLVGAEIARNRIDHVASEQGLGKEPRSDTGLFARVSEFFSSRASCQDLGAAVFAELSTRGIAEVEVAQTPPMLYLGPALGDTLLVLKPTAFGKSLEMYLREQLR
jgi:hypothetical protein